MCCLVYLVVYSSSDTKHDRWWFYFLLECLEYFGHHLTVLDGEQILGGYCLHLLMVHQHQLENVGREVFVNVLETEEIEQESSDWGWSRSRREGVSGSSMVGVCVVGMRVGVVVVVVLTGRKIWKLVWAMKVHTRKQFGVERVL